MTRGHVRQKLAEGAPAQPDRHGPGLSAKRLEKAAAHGKALGILFSYEGLQTQPSGVALRIRLESGREGRAVYLLNGRGETLAGEAL